MQPATSEQPNEFAAVHIPGAVSLDYLLNRASTEPGFWLPRDNRRALYGQAGVTPDKRAIVTCRPGARASVTHVAPRLTGL